MTNQEIAQHRQMKIMNPSYPRLPKLFRGKSSVRKNKGHNESVTRGFLSRVKNWKRNQG